MIKFALLTVLIFIIACNSPDQKTQTPAAAASSKQLSEETVHQPEIGEDERLIYYTCPMESHKHIHHVDPGKCEECGMDLVAGVITTKDKMEYYGCPMLIHSHIRQETEGTCSECGMKLMPMRLVAENK